VSDATSRRARTTARDRFSREAVPVERAAETSRGCLGQGTGRLLACVMTGPHRRNLRIVYVHRVHTVPASGRVAGVAVLTSANGPTAAEVGETTPRPSGPMAVTFAAAPDAAGFVVVPVRDAQLVVHALSLQPAAASDTVPEPLALDVLPAVLSCAALMLWMALRRAH
jgi:hypothetical protein